MYSSSHIWSNTWGCMCDSLENVMNCFSLLFYAFISWGNITWNNCVLVLFYLNVNITRLHTCFFTCTLKICRDSVILLCIRASISTMRWYCRLYYATKVSSYQSYNNAEILPCILHNKEAFLLALQYYTAILQTITQTKHRKNTKKGIFYPVDITEFWILPI